MKFFDSRFDLPVSASIRSANFLLDVVICVFVPVSSSPRPPQTHLCCNRGCKSSAFLVSHQRPFPACDLMKQRVGTLISRWILLTGHRAHDKLSFTRDSSDAGRGVRRKGGVLTRWGVVLIGAVVFVASSFIYHSIDFFFSL